MNEVFLPRNTAAIKRFSRFKREDVMKFRRACMPALLLSMAAFSVCAADFPEGAQPVKPDDLKAAMAGKVFSVKAAKGPVWRWQFNPDATFALAIGNYADSGTWSVDGSSVCQESKRGNTDCNDIRSKDDVLYLKRDNGDIVVLQPQ